MSVWCQRTGLGRDSNQVHAGDFTVGPGQVEVGYVSFVVPISPFSSALVLALVEEGYSDVIIAPDRVHAADGDGTRWTAPLSPELESWIDHPRPAEVRLTFVADGWN
jgi:hypothetical protein